MNFHQRNGLFALLLIAGGIVAYRNRASVQRFLESRGIRTPLDRTGRLIDTIRSGVARLAGRAEHGVREAQDEVKQAS